MVWTNSWRTGLREGGSLRLVGSVLAAAVLLGACSSEPGPILGQSGSDGSIELQAAAKLGTKEGAKAKRLTGTTTTIARTERRARPTTTAVPGSSSTTTTSTTTSTTVAPTTTTSTTSTTTSTTSTTTTTVKATTTTVPVDTAADEAAIATMFATVTNLDLPFANKVAYIEDGAALEEAHRVYVNRAKLALLEFELDSVTVNGDKATFAYSVGSQSLGFAELTGDAVRGLTVWQITQESLCASVSLAGVPCP